MPSKYVNVNKAQVRLLFRPGGAGWNSLKRSVRLIKIEAKATTPVGHTPAVLRTVAPWNIPAAELRVKSVKHSPPGSMKEGWREKMTPGQLYGCFGRVYNIMPHALFVEEGTRPVITSRRPGGAMWVPVANGFGLAVMQKQVSGQRGQHILYHAAARVMAKEYHVTVVHGA